MANQAAIRLRSRREGFAIPSGTDAADVALGPDRAAPRLELRCFGSFAALRRGQPIAAESFTRSKALVLLKILAIRSGVPVHRDVLMEQIWPEVDPRRGANRLHGVVHDLRSVIEPRRDGREWTYIRNQGEHYYLDCRSSVDVDVVRFRALLALAQRRASDDETCALLAQAVDLYRGDLFADDPFATWCEQERRDLRERYIDALQQLGNRHHIAGRGDVSLGYSRRAWHAAPFREDLLVAHVKLLMELGRPAEAQAACEHYERLVRDEMGIVPSEAVHAPCGRLLRQSGVKPRSPSR